MTQVQVTAVAMGASAGFWRWYQGHVDREVREMLQPLQTLSGLAGAQARIVLFALTGWWDGEFSVGCQGARGWAWDCRDQGRRRQDL